MDNDGTVWYESKELLVALGTLLAMISKQLGLELTTEQIAAFGVALMAIFRIISTKGPILRKKV
jgi:hypothetical protein